MKTLELNAYCVQEMNAEEMRETEGGFWQAILAGVTIYLIISSIENPSSFAAGFKAAYQ